MLRASSDRTTFEKNARIIMSKLTARGYPAHLLNNALGDARFEDRSDKLVVFVTLFELSPENTTHKGAAPGTTTYQTSPGLPAGQDLRKLSRQSQAQRDAKRHHYHHQPQLRSILHPPAKHPSACAAGTCQGGGQCSHQTTRLGTLQDEGEHLKATILETTTKEATEGGLLDPATQHASPPRTEHSFST